MRAFVDADRKAIDELSAEPSGEQRDRERDSGQIVRTRNRRARIRVTREPAHREQQRDHDIPESVPDADRARTRVLRNRQPIDESEQRGAESEDHAGEDHPVSDDLEIGATRDEVSDVEEKRRREQPKGKDDEHLVNRMPEELRSRVHDKPPLFQWLPKPDRRGRLSSTGLQKGGLSWTRE